MINLYAVLAAMAKAQIWVVTVCKGKLVGSDQFGNRYYTERRPAKGRRARRWVLYQGEPEATKVPPEWYGWLHHTTAEPMLSSSPYHRPWQIIHKPNRSGSVEAYRPAGHLLVGGPRPHATGDYEPWLPE